VSDRAADGLTLVQSRTKPGGPPKVGVRTLAPGRVIETYSAGVKLAIVARGEADVYVNDYDGFHDWDVCAGHVLVEEAGGRVSLFDGRPVVYGAAGAKQRNGLLASNGRVHDDVVRKIGAP
jgi:3'(2'), 5'-bisphosphate nucleotidase